MGKKKRKRQLQETKPEPQAKPVSKPKFTLPDNYLALWKIAILCLLVFAVGFLVYANTLKAEFIWDDEYLIINNTQIKSFSHIKSIFKNYVGYGSENINNFYRPIQELSNMIDFRIWGLSPMGFHLTNTILHALAALMVFLLIKAMIKDPLAALIGALFWAVHPVHSEAVAYIAGRADPLYAFFMLFSMLLFINYVRSNGKNFLQYSFSIFFFVVALLAKEMAFIMPLLLFLYMFYFLRKTENNTLFSKFKWAWVPYAVIIAFYGYLRATVLSFSDIAPASAFLKIPFVYRILTFFRTIITYIQLMLFPSGLHMERVISITRSIFQPDALFALGVVITIIWAARWTYKKNYRVESFGIVWFFACLLPVSNIVPINSFLAEHWIYIASIGPFMILGSALSKVWRRIPSGAKSLHAACALAVLLPILLYANATITRNRDWKDEISFFNSTLKYHPKNARLYLNLGNTYYEKRDIDNAIAQYNKAIEINKNYAVAYGNIGSAYLSQKKPDKALEYLIKAVGLQPNYPIAHYNLGIIYYERNELKKALAELELATEQLPQFYQAHNMKARICLRMGSPDLAAKAFELSLKIYPDQPDTKKTFEDLKRLKP